MEFKVAASLFKALSDETRLRIVDMLSGHELCACNLLEEFSISQPTLSYHMKILTECGLVIGRKDGSWMRYQLDMKRYEEMQEFLEAIQSIGK